MWKTCLVPAGNRCLSCSTACLSHTSRHAYTPVSSSFCNMFTHHPLLIITIIIVAIIIVVVIFIIIITIINQLSKAAAASIN
jgi:hypothetical protein